MTTATAPTKSTRTRPASTPTSTADTEFTTSLKPPAPIPSVGAYLAARRRASEATRREAVLRVWQAAQAAAAGAGFDPERVVADIEVAVLGDAETLWLDWIQRANGYRDAAKFRARFDVVDAELSGLKKRIQDLRARVGPALRVLQAAQRAADYTASRADEGEAKAREALKRARESHNGVVAGLAAAERDFVTTRTAWAAANSRLQTALKNVPDVVRALTPETP